jgi:hypothetical protein
MTGGSTKTRGKNKATVKLIETMFKIAEEMKPITGRGIGYKLFAAGLIPSMSTKDMKVVYRALKIAREEETIPWHWIVDETRDLELISTWKHAREFADGYFFGRDLWQDQPHKVEVWSEKGTVRGVVQPVLDELAVGFRPMHGYSSATVMWEACNPGIDRRPLVALYIGDYDPSGMNMSEQDIPGRIREYGGHHIQFRRIALTREHTNGLLPFSVESKQSDPRYRWFKQTYGGDCWELDAMDPRTLRDLVRREIEALIDRELWEAQEAREKEDQQSLDLVLRNWALMRSLHINGGAP